MLLKLASLFPNPSERNNTLRFKKIKVDVESGTSMEGFLAGFADTFWGTGKFDFTRIKGTRVFAHRVLMIAS